MSDVGLVARAALPTVAPESIAAPNGKGPGVTIMERFDLAFVGVAARKNSALQLAEAVRRSFSTELPTTPRRVGANGLAFLWTGPDRWFAVGPRSRTTLETELRDCVGTFASITNLSDSRAILRVSGAHARDLFAKGLPVDLHPRVFKSGDVAISTVGHIAVQLWQIDDSPSYQVALFRSLAQSFLAWLMTSGAEYGIQILPTRLA